MKMYRIGSKKLPEVVVPASQQGETYRALPPQILLIPTRQGSCARTSEPCHARVCIVTPAGVLGMLSDGDVCPCCGLRADEKLEHGAEVAAERKPVGLQWRKAKGMLNLVQHGTGKSDKSEYGKPPMQPHSTSLRDFRRASSDENARHSQSLRNVSHEVRYRRPSTSSIHSSSSEPANRMEYDVSSPLSYPQDPRTLAKGGSFRINPGQLRSSTDLPESQWVAGQLERLSYPEASSLVYGNIDPQQRGAPTPDGQSRTQTAKPVSLKAQIKEQFKIQALQWQPPNYIAPIVKDANMMKQIEKAEKRKVFRARNARK